MMQVGSWGALTRSTKSSLLRLNDNFFKISRGTSAARSYRTLLKSTPLRPPSSNRIPARHASTVTAHKELLPPTDLLPDTSPSTTSGVVLRPYQEDAITACLSALEEGITRMGVSSPTGSGKTTMFMNLIPAVVARRRRKRGKTLILVNGVELANQAENAARRILGDEWSVEVEQADRVASGRADVTIATNQTLLNEDRLRKFDPGVYDLVIVDEAHHAAAKSYLRTLQYFNEGVKLPKTVDPIDGYDHGHKTPVIGFSATFSRQDQLSLGVVFEKIVFHRDVTHMLRDGWLSPVRCTTVKADLKLSQVEVSSSTGDFTTASLSSHIDTHEINELVVRTYLHLAEERRSTLVFCVSLEHVANVVKSFREAGIDARSVSSLSKAAYRKRTLEEFIKGEFPVLVNCEVLTEGTDLPVIDCILLARPTKSRNLLAQMIGRGLRLSPGTGKIDCYIIDIVDSTSQGLLVTPTLLGLTHDDIEAEEIQEKERYAAGTGTEEHVEKNMGLLDNDYNVTFTDTDDPFGLGGARFKAIKQMSFNAWVACGKGRYVLELMNNSWIQIDPSSTANDASWVITYNWKAHTSGQAGSSPVYKLNQHVAYAHDLERAFQTADVFATKKVGHERSLQLSRRAPWRQRPASPKAMDLLLRMKGLVTKSAEGPFDPQTSSPEQGIIFIAGKEVDVRSLTAGEISSYLCAAKHGAIVARKTQDAKDATRMAKLEKKAAKERKRAEDLPLPMSI